MLASQDEKRPRKQECIQEDVEPYLRRWRRCESPSQCDVPRGNGVLNCGTNARVPSRGTSGQTGNFANEGKKISRTPPGMVMTAHNPSSTLVHLVRSGLMPPACSFMTRE